MSDTELSVDAFVGETGQATKATPIHKLDAVETRIVEEMDEKEER